MRRKNTVTIRIDGDDSGYVKALNNVGAKTKAGLADVKAGLDLTAAAAKSLFDVASQGIRYVGNIEQLQTSFEVMTGSAEKAAEVVSRLRTMGAETPFEMADIAGVTQLLMQYGFTADDALDKMQMLGDISQGNSQALQSIALGYAQMSSAQKVNLQDIKQMINGGFNPLQEISERTGESMASLYDRISKGTMAVDEITESMRHATSEGGKFFQSMEKQSQTLNGQLSTLKDNANQLLGSLTSGLAEDLRTELLPLANNMIGTLQESFDKRGLEGLMDTATGMLPDLLNMMTGKMEDSIASLSKFAPKAVTAIMRSIPGAIRSGTQVLPQITTTLFDVASLVVSDLVVMLPDLVPVLISGFADMFGSVLTGAFKLVDSVFVGVEQAIHKGKTKVAGMWVDDEQIAKFDYSMEIDLDTSNAESTINTAYQQIRDALKTDLLTGEQRNEIIDLIGEDYQVIYNKLVSFGLSEADANNIASSVTDASAAIQGELSKLEVGVPTATLMKWFIEANNSRLQLRNTLQKAGLADSDVQTILDVYDTMLGKVADGTPSIMESIYDKLTDGEPDDEQTVSAISSTITEYINSLLASLDAAYQKKLSELDVTAEDYKERKAELDVWYSDTKASITSMDSGMRSLVNALAGAPTAVVQARMDEFVEIERQLRFIDQEIDRVSGKAAAEAERAFNVVRAGAQADEVTISLALKFKSEEFKIDKQSAEDQYAAAVAELNELFDSGTISKETYNARMSEAQSELETAKATAKTTYEQALGEIFAGIAESEGISAAVEEAGVKLDLAQALESAVEELRGKTGLYNNAFGDVFTGILSEYLQISPDFLSAMPVETIAGYIESWALSVYEEAEKAMENADSEKLFTAYESALDEGLFAGTGFDTKEQAEQFAAIVGSIMDDGAAQAVVDAETIGSDLVDSVSEGAAGSETAGIEVGNDFGSGYVSGIGAWLRAAYNKAYAMSRAAVQGAADGQDSHSPSKLAKKLGGDFGSGYNIGLRDSMARAAETARMLTGRIVTSADIAQSMRVNIPNLQQEIMIANEQSPTRLYVNGRELGRVMAADNQYAQNSYNRSVALGVGK